MYEGDDSYFLSDELKKFLKNKDKKIKILDLGCGSGIQAKICRNLGFKNILAVDINKEVIEDIKKQGFKARQSDLFSNLKGRLSEGNRRCLRFNLIIFNPPYLPQDKFDREKDTAGGKLGDETILKFLKQAKSRLTEKGKVLLLLSSLTPRKRISKELKKQKLKKIKLAKKSFFFEKLEVWLIS